MDPIRLYHTVLEPLAVFVAYGVLKDEDERQNMRVDTRKGRRRIFQQYCQRTSGGGLGRIQRDDVK